MTRRHAIELLVRDNNGRLSTLSFTLAVEGATAPGLARLAGKFRRVIAAAVSPPPVHARDFPIVDDRPTEPTEPTDREET